MSKIVELKKEMISVYGNKCWMNELWIPRRNDLLTLHHILEVRNGGITDWGNSALLSAKSHQYLNYLDMYYHYYYEELNYLFKELNRTYAPPNEDYYYEVQKVLKKVL